MKVDEVVKKLRWLMLLMCERAERGRVAAPSRDSCRVAALQGSRVNVAQVWLKLKCG